MRQLVERVRRGDPDALRECEGFVLVGGCAAETNDQWQYATEQMVQDVRALHAALAARTLSLEVIPLRKRISTFLQVILVGRASSNDIVLDHPSISKLHARLRVEAEHVVVEDAKSRNGVRCNGRRISGETIARPGDRVAFGSCEYVLHDLPGLRRETAKAASMTGAPTADID